MSQAASVLPASQSKPSSPSTPFRLALIIIAMVTLYGWYAMTRPGYSSGSTTGYNLGLAGAIMMLLLFLYPLRKHVSWLGALGRLRRWLSIHMLLGICGPVLIVFHSRFELESINATIAMVSMLIVSSSGIAGRFFYTRIHDALRGRRLAAKELRTALAESLAAINGGKTLPDKGKKMLESFEVYAQHTPRGILFRTFKFLTVGLRKRWTAMRIRRQLADIPGAGRIARQMDNYLDGLQRVAQFAIYERLFSLWHMLHVPLVVVLILSAIYHVIAVHMY